MTKTRPKEVYLLWFHEFFQIDFCRFASFPFLDIQNLSNCVNFPSFLMKFVVVFCYLEPLCGVAHVVIRLYEDVFFENRKMPKEMQMAWQETRYIVMTLFSSVSVLQFFFYYSSWCQKWWRSHKFTFFLPSFFFEVAF